MADSKCRSQSPEYWPEWSEWLAAGLDARNRWRMPILLPGMLLASGRRMVTTWLRAAGVSDDYQDYYYFLTSIGRNRKKIASQLTVLVLRNALRRISQETCPLNDNRPGRCRPGLLR